VHSNYVKKLDVVIIANFITKQLHLQVSAIDSASTTRARQSGVSRVPVDVGLSVCSVSLTPKDAGGHLRWRRRSR